MYDHDEHHIRWKAALERELERYRLSLSTRPFPSQEWEDATYTAAVLQKAIIEHAKYLQSREAA
jgi:hypothetical protein